MITYVHKKTKLIVERDINSIQFSGKGDHNVRIPKSIVEDSLDWERRLAEVKTYPAELVEPLFNCRMEHYENYVDKLLEYKEKIQNS